MDKAPDVDWFRGDGLRMVGVCAYHRSVHTYMGYVCMHSQGFSTWLHVGSVPPRGCGVFPGVGREAGRCFGAKLPFLKSIYS